MAGTGAVYNAVVLLDQGKVQTQRYKHDLPNYGVFDEKRVFAAGPAPGPINFSGVRIGVPICEDIWTDEICETLVETGAELLLVPNGSPFEKNKDDVRLIIVVARVTETGLPLAYLNQVGGQDELVFDGGSLRSQCRPHARRSRCRRSRRRSRITAGQRGDDGWRSSPARIAAAGRTKRRPGGLRARACATMSSKNGFPGVVLGLSGGIDSAVVAAMAVDALGPERVHCVMLPYRYTARRIA